MDYVFPKDDDTLSSNAGGGDDPPPIGSPATFRNGTVADAVANANRAPADWLAVIRSYDEAGTIKLRKVRRQRKPPVCVKGAISRIK